MFAWFFLFGLESAFAEEPVISKEDSEKVVKILNGFITAAAALMGMVTSFITMFLYPGWVNGTLFGLQDYLKIMWILVSNIVYFIFAFILIAIAFMNIIGKGEWTWELKQAMPKFIIGVLIVPFSWFFVQFLLSLSAILTVWVLTLPYDSFQWNELFEKAMENKELAGKEICKDVIISFNGDFSGAEGGVGWTTQLGEDANELDENIKCKSDGKITVKELLTGTDENGDISSNAAGLQNSIFWVMSIYSYGILRIDELDTINAAQLSSVKTIADLIFKIIFDVLFIAVYLLLMIALLLALFVRGVRLWVYMMLSPIFGLLYFFWKSGEWFWDSGKAFNIKEFVALALVPVYVSAALAFGLVFILVASQWIEDTNEGSDTMKAGGFSLTILWAHGDSGDDGREEKAIIWKLVVEIFGIVILWIAVMAALGASDTTKAIVEPIAAFGKSVWDLAAKAPTYAPIIPTGNGERMWVAGLSTIWSSLEAAPRQAAQKRWWAFADRMLWDASDTQQIARGLQNSTTIQKQNGEALETALTSIWTWIFTSNQERRDQINHINTELGLEINLWNITDPQRIATEIERAVGEKYGTSYNTTFRGENSLSNFIKNLQNPNPSDNEWSWENSSTPDNTTNNVNITIPGQATPQQFNAGQIKFDTSNSITSGNAWVNELKWILSGLDRNAADTALTPAFSNTDQRKALLDLMWIV